MQYRNDLTGNVIELPALATDSGIVLSHLRYLAFHRARSESWRVKNTLAMRLLIEYIQANQTVFNDPVRLLQSFTEALSVGTINYQQMDDPSGLYWKPRQPSDARILLGSITQYLDWLA